MHQRITNDDDDIRDAGAHIQSKNFHWKSFVQLYFNFLAEIWQSAQRQIYPIAQAQNLCFPSSSNSICIKFLAME